MSTENDKSDLLDRDSFRKGVLQRDGYRCVICGASGVRLDAHHIIERRLWDDGGYYLDNGATLCDEKTWDGPGPNTGSDIGCHMLAEQTTIACNDIRAAAKIRRVIIPDHLYADLYMNPSYECIWLR